MSTTPDQINLWRSVPSEHQMVIPEAVREQARIRPGDEVDIGYANGLVVLRKRRPLTPARVRSLLLAGGDLPELTAKDEDAVAAAIQRVRSRTQS